MRKVVITIVLALISPTIVSSRQNKAIPWEPPEPSEYEIYFRSLTPEEQVAEYVRHSEEYYIELAPHESVVASHILSHESGIEAMPYLRREFARLDFEYCSDDPWTSFCNESPISILGLIAGMVWLTGFPKNEGVILRPSDEDIAWFAEEAQAKIRRYIATYNRIDGMWRVEQAVLDMTNREAAVVFRDTNSVRPIYNKYVSGNPELEALVGLPEDLVFEGFEGPVLEPQPPLMVAP